MITKIGRDAVGWEERKQLFNELPMHELSLLEMEYPDLFKKDPLEMEYIQNLKRKETNNWMPPFYGAGFGALGATVGNGLGTAIGKNENAALLGSLIGGGIGGGIGAKIGDKQRERWATGEMAAESERVRKKVVDQLKKNTKGKK